MNPEGYRILKILNNNVVLAQQYDKEKILFSKGIGYKKRVGDVLPQDFNFDKIFSIDDKDNSNRFKELIMRVDSSIVGLCEEVIYMIDKEYGEELDEKIHVALTDHIAFTIMRLKNNDEILNPFLIETETMYKREFETAKKAVSIFEAGTGINIPDGEIGFIALHIHSARNKGKLSETIKSAYITSSIADLIEDELNIELDRSSLDYARFVIHIQFALKRMMSNLPIKNGLLKTIKKKYKSSYNVALKAADIIESELNLNVVPDEIGYIAVHIEKLRSAS